MKATMAIMTREVMARSELLLLAVVVAVVVSLLPYLPNIEAYEAADVRTVGSGTAALALGCLLALVLGATVFGNDLSEGRLGFFFARPVSGSAIWWGRVLALIGLIWAVEAIVLLPSFCSGGAYIFSAAYDIGLLARLAFVFAPLLLFLLAHAASIIVRAGTPWMFFDLGGIVVVTIVAWLNLKPLLGIGEQIALLVIAGALGAALLLALAVGGAVGVTVGRVDLKRAHGAQSLALWGTMAICTAAITVYGGWLRSFGPREINDVDVRGVAPDGGWVEVIGRANNRLDVERRYLISTDGSRWVPLPPRKYGIARGVVFALNGDTAVWRSGGPVEEPRSLWWADLSRPDPMARFTTLVVSPEAALAVSGDGTLLAILEEGTVSVYNLGEERLVRAIRLPERLQRVAVVFVDVSTLRLFARIDVDGAETVFIAEIDVAAGELVRTGATPGFERIYWFAVDASLQHMIVSSSSADGQVRTKTLFDAVDGSFIRYLDTEGFPRFLEDGRMRFTSQADNGSIIFAIETVDGDGRLVHSLSGAAGSRIHGEAVPGGVVVAHHAEPGDRTKGVRLALLDVDTGETRNIGSHIRDTVRCSPWQWGIDMGFVWHRDQPSVSRLFIGQSGALVRWDPESGEMVHVVGGRQ